ncbi:MAG: hypothetical protein HXS47_11830 [Theionarchaea archaeon]|nr:hypothetical protein [Theionarchaea archaeon]
MGKNQHKMDYITEWNPLFFHESIVEVREGKIPGNRYISYSPRSFQEVIL